MKIAVCTPALDDTKLGYSYSLARMAWHTAKNVPDIDLEVFVERGSIVCYARNELINQARKWGADAILWIDSDITFPCNALERLVGLNRDVVSANYTQRGAARRPTALIDDQYVVTTADAAERAVVQEVSVVGLGFCLMRLAALNALSAPIVRFHYEKGSLVGEDYHLCSRLRERGTKIFVDHWLSAHIGHIGEQILTYRDSKGGENDASAVLPRAGPQ